MHLHAVFIVFRLPRLRAIARIRCERAAVRLGGGVHFRKIRRDARVQLLVGALHRRRKLRDIVFGQAVLQPDTGQRPVVSLRRDGQDLALGGALHESRALCGRSFGRAFSRGFSRRFGGRFGRRFGRRFGGRFRHSLRRLCRSAAFGKQIPCRQRAEDHDQQQRQNALGLYGPFGYGSCHLHFPSARTKPCPCRSYCRSFALRCQPFCAYEGCAFLKFDG